MKEYLGQYYERKIVNSGDTEAPKKKFMELLEKKPELKKNAEQLMRQLTARPNRIVDRCFISRINVQALEEILNG